MTETDSPTEDAPDAESIESTTEDRDVREYLLRGALLVLGLVAVVALFQFYTSTVSVINEWIAVEYRAMFRAAYHLIVLLAAGIGISLVVRELSGD